MATLLWSQEFNSPLDLKSPSNPSGVWMPDDYWQSPVLGYEDFAGTSFNINPNDPAMAGYNPFSVSNGVLDIKAERTPAALTGAIASEMAQEGQPGGVPAWTGGILITNPAVQTFTYGYFEFKAKFDAGKGEFPALWFYSADATLNPGKTSAEIDLNEIFGKPGAFHTSQHGASGSEVGSVNTDTTQWHTYGMDWHPNKVDFYEDGKLIYSMPPDQAAYYNGVKMDIRVNFSMDAPWFGADAHSDSSTPSQLHAQIDWIRQYDQFQADGANPVPPPPVEPPPPVTPPPTPGTDDHVTVSAVNWANGKPIDLGGGNDTLDVVVTAAGQGIHTLGAPSVSNVEHTNLYGQPGSDWLTLRGDQLDAFLKNDAHIDLGGGWNIIDLATTSAELNLLGADGSRIHNVHQFETVGNAGVTIDMHGQSEAFKFYGQGGSDTFIGGTGADTMVGRAGSDYLDGGGGADVLTGGVGNDIFVAHNGARITDFVHGQDHIQVANPAGVTWSESGSNTIVHVDSTTTLLLTGVGLHLDLNDFAK